MTRALLLLLLLAVPAHARTLRVAADPNNLPFSNAREEGFENALAKMLAKDLGAKLEYAWRAQRRGFFRESFQGAHCDLVLGVPEGFERAAVTAPYYRSSYVFVTKRGRGPPVTSLDDPRLRTMRIGIAVIGDDGADPPTTLALARRGIVDNVTGYSVYGDYREANPPLRLLDALDRGDIDVALAWGPVAGAAARGRRYTIEPVTPDPDPRSAQSFSFAIGIGVRKDEPDLKAEVERFLARRKPEIDRLLAERGIVRP